MSYTTHKYGPLQPMSRCVYFFRFNFTRPMSRLQVVFRRWFVCDENISCTITCSCVDRIRKVSIKLFTQVWHQFWRSAGPSTHNALLCRWIADRQNWCQTWVNSFIETFRIPSQGRHMNMSWCKKYFHHTQIIPWIQPVTVTLGV